MRRTILGIALLALCALPASAAAIKLKDGTTVNCTVKSYDPATKTLYVHTEAGQDAQYTLDQLNARSAYLVNASLIPKDDAKALFQVANFARDAGLYAQSARHYADVVKLDPTMKEAVDAEMTKLKRYAAAACMKNAQDAVAKKDYPEAERWLKKLMEKLPDQPEASQASTMLDQYYEKQRADKMAAAEAKASAALKKDVEPGKKRYEQMVEKTKKGLQAKSDSDAERQFKGALSDGDYVLDQIEKIEKKYSDDSSVKERAQDYRKLVTDQMVEIHLSLASQEAVKSDYKGAQREVNAALALDPKSEAALSMRARIEDYSSRGIGWRW